MGNWWTRKCHICPKKNTDWCIWNNNRWWINWKIWQIIKISNGLCDIMHELVVSVYKAKKYNKIKLVRHTGSKKATLVHVDLLIRKERIGKLKNICPIDSCYIKLSAKLANFILVLNFVTASPLDCIFCLLKSIYCLQ